MGMSMVVSKQIHTLFNIPAGGLKTLFLRTQPPKEKVLVVMGATGTGKSRLAVELATRFPSEIVNSDKIQIHQGLDIATNKITEEEQCGIPHHLLGIINPNADFTAGNFCAAASLAVRSIAGRGHLPILAGGSNSYIEALIDDNNHEFRSRYDLCFLWVDVSIPVLHNFLSDRVDRMVQNGMVDEVRNTFNPNNADYSRGIRRAIGVPELDRYFRAEKFLEKEAREKLLQEAIDEIKSNNCKLACRQLEKIYRLRNVKGWKLHRLDATGVLLKRGKEADQAWETLVAAPSYMILNRFLYDVGHRVYGGNAAGVRATAMAGKPLAAAGPV
ncbi:adenylate dimethylallyltransferase (ADP/ATP-dependent) [Bertholletia excelsa]